jgi:YebC/PmpR family DNA-binding regulatory protein
LALAAHLLYNSNMSGHSKWSTIKRKKEANDIVRAKIFGKLGKAISIAAKEGIDPDMNAKLRMAIEQAKNMNMPKENIDRAIAKGIKDDTQLEEVNYEGFGPGGVGIIVEVATDNTRRTAQEIKYLFDRGGGNLGGPNSVAFNFEPKGYIAVDKKTDTDEEILTFIDMGVDDVEEEGGLIEIKEKIVKLGYKIRDVDLVRKPKIYVEIIDREMAKKTIALLESLEAHDDVQKVYANSELPEDLGN